jgi:hypothetical protein
MRWLWWNVTRGRLRWSKARGAARPPLNLCHTVWDSGRLTPGTAPEQQPRAALLKWRREATSRQRPPPQFQVGQTVSVFALPLRFGRARRRADSFRF